MTITHYYRETPPPHNLISAAKALLSSLSLQSDADSITCIRTENCFNVQSNSLTATEQARLEWLLAETFDRQGLKQESSSFDKSENAVIMEFGPRMTFTSAFSSNAVSICHACGLTSIDRLERSKRFMILSSSLSEKAVTALKGMLHDRMTEEEYLTPLTNFDAGVETEPVVVVPIMEEGRAALEKINAQKGLGFDDFDLDYYTDLFKVNKLVAFGSFFVYCLVVTPSNPFILQT